MIFGRNSTKHIIPFPATVCQSPPAFRDFQPPPLAYDRICHAAGECYSAPQNEPNCF